MAHQIAGINDNDQWLSMKGGMTDNNLVSLQCRGLVDLVHVAPWLRDYVGQPGS